MTSLHSRAGRIASRQETAWAPGTIANYASSIRKYLKFCYQMDTNPTLPIYQNICAYAEYLVDSTPSPRTVANHISHLRTYLRKAQCSTAQVDNYRVKWALNAINRDTTYVPRIKQAFPIDSLQRMVLLLPKTPQGRIIKASVLLMYYAALRQSKVLPYSSTSFDYRRHLSRRDVVINNGALTVRIKHAKNLQTIYQFKTVILQPSPNQELCVVQAVRQIYIDTPTQHLDEACVLFHDSRRPVPVEFVRRKWKEHINQHGIHTEAMSLHSLRKAAATAAHDEGCSELDIQRYGGWHLTILIYLWLHICTTIHINLSFNLILKMWMPACTTYHSYLFII